MIIRSSADVVAVAVHEVTAPLDLEDLLLFRVWLDTLAFIVLPVPLLERQVLQVVADHVLDVLVVVPEGSDDPGHPFDEQLPLPINIEAEGHHNADEVVGVAELVLSGLFEGVLDVPLVPPAAEVVVHPLELVGCPLSAVVGNQMKGAVLIYLLDLSHQIKELLVEALNNVRWLNGAFVGSRNEAPV